MVIHGRLQRLPPLNPETCVYPLIRQKRTLKPWLVRDLEKGRLSWVIGLGLKCTHEGPSKRDSEGHVTTGEDDVRTEARGHMLALKREEGTRSQEVRDCAALEAGGVRTTDVSPSD